MTHQRRRSTRSLLQGLGLSVGLLGVACPAAALDYTWSPDIGTAWDDAETFGFFQVDTNWSPDRLFGSVPPGPADNIFIVDVPRDSFNPDNHVLNLNGSRTVNNATFNGTGERPGGPTEPSVVPINFRIANGSLTINSQIDVLKGLTVDSNAVLTSNGTTLVQGSRLFQVNGTFNANGLVVINSGGNLTSATSKFNLAAGNTLLINAGGQANLSGSFNLDGTQLLRANGGAANFGGGNLFVGFNSSGTLEVNNGGTVSNFAGFLGRVAGSNGTATVTGNNSTWTNNENLNVGSSGTGELTIYNGGRVNSLNGIIGQTASATGTVTIYDSGSLWDNTGGLYIGGTASSSGGTGTLNLDGGTVNAAGPTRIWSGGTLNANGGTLNANGGLEVISGGALNFADGQINVTNGAFSTPGSGYTLNGGVSGDMPQLTLGSGATATYTSDVNVGTSRDARIIVEDGGVMNTGRVWTSRSSTGSNSEVILRNGGLWNATAQFYVGDVGTGTLTIESGADLISGNAFIGRGNINADGTATVTGTGSTWTVNAPINIGDGGTGTLNINNGGYVSNTRADLGRSGNGTGTANVVGDGSQWINTSTLTVGASGTGTLDINSGGVVVTNSRANIGASSGSTGTVTVAGIGSTLISDTGLYIGGSNTAAGGSGTLNINSDGTVNVTDTTKLWSGGTLNLNGGTLNADGGVDAVDGTLNFADGQINVTNGAFSTPGSGYTLNGGLSGDMPQLTLGSGATATYTSEVNIGTSRDARIIVEDGGVMNTGRVWTSRSSTSSNSEVILRNGGQWNASAQFYVGDVGTGTLTIESGADLESGNAFIGRGNINADGTATVTGNGSTWTVNAPINIGDGGTGTLNINDGGVVSNTRADLGRSGNGTGTANVVGNGSQWINTSTLAVGASGTGTLKINSGGVVVTNFRAIIGASPGSTGTVNVDGDGSTLTSTGDLILGGTATGDGGTAKLTTTNNGTVFVGDAAQAGGLAAWLTVSDANNMDGQSVGGRLIIRNGATLNHGSIASLGDESNEYGYATVTGNGSTFNISWFLAVGDSGTGQLNVMDRGRVETKQGTTIGRLSDGQGTATIDGIGSELVGTNLNSVLRIGERGTGELIISNGGLASNNTGFIGQLVNSSGTVTVTGPGSTWTNTGGLNIGGTATSSGGTGTLNIQTGGTVSADELTWIGSGGTINLDGGTLNTTTLQDTDGGAFNYTDGTLIVETFDGNLTQQGGTLAPGNSPGTTTITGDYNLNAGAIAIELAGSGHDQVAVSGGLNLGASTTLDVTLLDSYNPGVAYLFNVLDFNTVSGTFGTINLPTLDGVLTWDDSYLYIDGTLQVVSSVTGDLDGDGDVDDDDLTIAVGNFTGANASAGRRLADGNYDADTDLDNADIGVILGNYSAAPTAYTAQLLASVPEPTSLTLLGLGGLLLGRRRRAS